MDTKVHLLNMSLNLHKDRMQQKINFEFSFDLNMFW